MADRVVVLGGSGFVGSAVMATLRGRGVDAVAVTAPRLKSRERSTGALRKRAARESDTETLVESFSGASCVVNAAGNPDASSLDEDVLTGANALLPAVVAMAAERAGVQRLVHVSSAVVQNDVSVLDESEDLRPFSPYSRSKALGEEVLRELADVSALHVVRYRPPSVHAPGRRVTRMIGKVARSPVATVARPGGQPTPQALLPNIADAIVFLATCVEIPPAVVAHPWEGVTCEGLMRDLSGGLEPRRVPCFLARLAVSGAKGVGRLHRPTAANARRIELLWLGQRQSPSWLDTMGWTPPHGPEAWQALGAATDEKSP